MADKSPCAKATILSAPGGDTGNTHTRGAAGGTISDFEGLLHEVPDDAVMADGVRYVRNLVDATSDVPITQTITNVISGEEYQCRIGAASAVGSTAVFSGAFTGTLTGDAADPQTFDAIKTSK